MLTRLTGWLLRRDDKLYKMTSTATPAAPSTSKETEQEMIERLLGKCSSSDMRESAASHEGEECCVCLEARATVRAYPCTHQVVCRRCAVTLIKNLLDAGKPQMQCVVCRSVVVRLKYVKRSCDKVVCRREERAPFELDFAHPGEGSSSSHRSSRASRSSNHGSF